MTGTREKVLVFEDLDVDWESLRTAINRAGFDVVRAKTPAEFRRHAPYKSFALILVDIYLGSWPMPFEKVGIDLTREVRKVNPDTPVLVVSDMEPRRSIVAEAIRAGAYDYVDKKEFLSDVQSAVNRVRSIVTDRGDLTEEEKYPLPIAFLLRDFLYSHTSAKRGVERMVELFEVILKLVTYALIGGHQEQIKSLLPDKLRAELARPSLGHFAQVLNTLPGADGLLSDLSRITKRKRFRTLCGQFIMLRNNYIGHGVTQAEAVYERLIAEHKAPIMELLDLLSMLKQWKLVWPSKPDIDNDWFLFNEAKIFRGSNPEPITTSLRTQMRIKNTDHVQLVNEDFTDGVDLYPWCQYLVCEQFCLNRKLFLYRLAREGEIWALDHIYGHSLQTRKGWPEIRGLTNIDPVP